MKAKTFEDLFIDQVDDLYDAEQRIVKALPKMMQAAHAVALKKVFEAHYAQTLQHVKRLDDVFRRLNRTPGGKTCEPVKRLLREGAEAMDAGSPDVRDAALIAAAQQMEHYEMAGYGTARTFAVYLGHTEIADLLQRTLQEESAADRQMTEVAENEVNARAAQ